MRRRIYALGLLLCLWGGGVSARTPAPSSTPMPLPVSGVDTPSPEAQAAATREPRGWRSVGGGGFDINQMTVEERTQLIADLQSANLVEQVRDMPVVQGIYSSRENPIYIGQRAQFKQEITFGSTEDGYLQESSIAMAMTDVVRGEDAAALVIEMNPLNELPPQGREYVVATFHIGITSNDPDELFTFTMYEFQPVNDRGKVLDYAFVTDDMGMLQLYSGGEGNLRVTALVDIGTELVFRYREQVWFSARDLSEIEALVEASPKEEE